MNGLLKSELLKDQKQIRLNTRSKSFYVWEAVKGWISRSVEVEESECWDSQEGSEDDFGKLQVNEMCHYDSVI